MKNGYICTIQDINENNILFKLNQNMKKYVFAILLVCFVVDVVCAQGRIRAFLKKGKIKMTCKDRVLEAPVDTVQLGDTVTFDASWDADVIDSVIISPSFYKPTRADLERAKYSFFVVPQATVKIVTLVYCTRSLLILPIKRKIVVVDKEGREIKGDMEKV